MSNNILSCNKEDFFYLAEAILKHGNCIRFKAEGRSMSPSIRGADIIKVSPITDNVASGDIILYRSRENTPVVHRVVRMDNGNILTKGDSALDFDAPIGIEQVLGKVVEIKKGRLRIRHVLSKVLHYVQGFRLYSMLARIILKPQDITIKHEVSLENGVDIKWAAKRGSRIVGNVDLSRVQFCKLNQKFAVQVTNLNQQQKDDNSAWLMTSLWVHYRYRRIGLGKRLVKEALDYLSKTDADEVRLYVLPSNRAAIRLYKDFGFAITDNKEHNPEFIEFIHLKKDVKDHSCHTP